MPAVYSARLLNPVSLWGFQQDPIFPFSHNYILYSAGCFWRLSETWVAAPVTTSPVLTAGEPKYITFKGFQQSRLKDMDGYFGWVSTPDSHGVAAMSDSHRFRQSSPRKSYCSPCTPRHCVWSVSASSSPMSGNNWIQGPLSALTDSVRKRD